MTGQVVLLESHRRKRARTCCGCSAEFTCYPHRLAELLERMEADEALVAEYRLCDAGTFERMAGDVRRVLEAIVTECLPDERTAR